MHGTEGRLIGWDPVSQSARWSVQEPIATNGGVLSTAGNLVFQGQGSGEFAAYAADSGKKVWSIQTGSAIESVPITFRVKGEQYILCPVGWGSGSRLFAPAWTMATPQSKRGPCAPAGFQSSAPPCLSRCRRTSCLRSAKPPQQTASPETIHRAQLFTENSFAMVVTRPETDGSGAWVLNGADSRSPLRAAGSPSRLVRNRFGRHSLGQGYARLRRSAEVCFPQSEDDGKRRGCDSCIRHRPGLEGLQPRAR